MNTLLRRARPLLGTLVEMRVEGLQETCARQALDAAFAEIERIHALMSFHAPDSDLAHIHNCVPGRVVEIDARTHQVLGFAQQLATASAGVFDVAVAAALVDAGALPRPRSAYEPDPDARSGDIELLPNCRVRLRRPLWLDLGGIAKGFAVDRAVEVLLGYGATQLCVNAGGDLRVSGARAEAVFLRTGRNTVPALPTLELRDASIATSASDQARAHRCGSSHAAVTPGLTVSVIAPTCMVADALTKVALAADAHSATRVLASFGASAARHDPRHGWMPLELAA